MFEHLEEDWPWIVVPALVVLVVSIVIVVLNGGGGDSEIFTYRM